MSEQEKTQSETIREKLRQYFKAGNDLTIKDIRKKIVRQVMADLKQDYPHLTYAHVSKHVPAIIKEGTGDDSSRTKTKAGANAEVDLSTPARVPNPNEVEQQQQQQQQPAGQQTPQATQPQPMTAEQLQQLGIPNVIAAMGGDAVKIYLEMKGILIGAKEIYKKIGVKPPNKAATELWLIQYTACAVKYGWKMPDWMDKAALAVLSVQVFAIPIATKFDLIGLAKGLFAPKKKATGQQPAESQEPLAEASQQP